MYNYKTGDILCMVSTPSFDPENPPAASEAQDGIYLNRFLSSAQVPGSIFKTVTLTAALENLPDLKDRTFTCTGETTVGGTVITCPKPHGKMDIASAFANSCNGVFGALAAELGGDTMTKYVEQAGLTRRMSVDGIMTAAGHYDVSEADKGQIGWSGVGSVHRYGQPLQHDDLHGCHRKRRHGCRSASDSGHHHPERIPTSWQRTEETDTLVQASTASQVKEMMKNNVVQTYGTDRFRGLDIGAKSGTAEVGGGQAPQRMVCRFPRRSRTPLRLHRSG